MQKRPKFFKKQREVYRCGQFFQVVRNSFQSELDIGSGKAFEPEAFEHAVCFDVPEYSLRLIPDSHMKQMFSASIRSIFLGEYTLFRYAYISTLSIILGSKQLLPKSQRHSICQGDVSCAVEWCLRADATRDMD